MFNLLRGPILALLLLFAPPVYAGWLVAETPHFRIHGKVSESRIRQEAAVLEDFHALLAARTGRKFDDDVPPLDIYLVDGRPQMVQIFPTMQKQVAGFYTATPGGILALASEPQGGQTWNEGREVLLHEYAHHFMMQAGSAAMPAWYVEGFAEYMMTADFRPDRIDFGGFSRGRVYVLQTLDWAPIDQVLARAPAVGMDRFYAQSWLLTHYLNRAEGMAPKRDAYLRRVAAGEDPVAAFRLEIADDLPAFEQRLKAYLKSRDFTFSRITRKPRPAAEVQVTSLPPAADAALLSLVAVQLPQTAENDTAQLARIRAAAARYPDEPWARRALAIGEAAAGDPKTAATLLDARLAETPDDPQLLRWRARLYGAHRPGASAADVSAARKLLGRAFKSAPNDWLVLRDYAETFLVRDAQIPDTVLDVLLLANRLAPQEQSLAMRAGVEVARTGDYALAENIIAPVVNNPHSGEPMLLERGLLDALKTGEKTGVEAALDGLGSISGRRIVPIGPGPSPGAPAQQ